MEVDFKVTMWTRATIDDEDKDKVLKALKSGEITHSTDLYELTDPQWEHLYDTQKEMTLEENGGEATIEAIESDDSLCGIAFTEFYQTTLYTNKTKNK